MRHQLKESFVCNDGEFYLSTKHCGGPIQSIWMTFDKKFNGWFDYVSYTFFFYVAFKAIFSVSISGGSMSLIHL